jgi:hypothetical protein
VGEVEMARVGEGIVLVDQYVHVPGQFCLQMG